MVRVSCSPCSERWHQWVKDKGEGRESRMWIEWLSPCASNPEGYLYARFCTKLYILPEYNGGMRVQSFKGSPL